MSARHGQDRQRDDDGMRPARRDTLHWLAAAAAWSSIPPAALAAPPVPAGGGYGTDPVLTRDAQGPWPRLLERAQRRTLSRLADVILPPGAGEPAPSALGISEFIDEWVSAPYPQQQEDRAAIVAGLCELAALARERSGRALEALDDAELVPLLDAMAARAEPVFFLRLRALVVGGYYTSDAGFKAIGYLGNVPRSAFPGVAPEVRALLDAELVKLGL